MKITQDVREYAADMARKAEEFRRGGSELYVVPHATTDTPPKV
jgi:hypothetical protein